MNKLIYLLLLSFLSANLFSQNINFTVKGSGPDDYEGCEDYTVTFNAIVAGSAAIDSIMLVDSTKKSTYIGHNEWTVNGRKYSFSIALSTGTYNPILRVLVGGTWKEVALKQRIKIYSNPTAFFRITTDSSQCFENNNVGFMTLSKTGVENHKITQVVFDLGDGKIMKGDSFGHHYPSHGNFDIVVGVIDEKGCTDEFVAKNRIDIKTQVGASFRVTGPVGCPTTTIKFNNRTSVSTSKIDSWEWEWSDGKRESYTTSDLSTHWDNFTRTYSKHGYHNPKLVVHTNYGCNDSVTLKDAIRTQRTNVEVKLKNTGTICKEDSVHFEWNIGKNVTQFLYTFGDPASLNKNIERSNPNPSHLYSAPGSYPITLMVLAPPCPAKDTSICCVHINGPQALIDLPRETFPGNNPTISKSYLERLNNDSAYEPQLKYITYGIKTTATPYDVGGLQNTFAKKGEFGNGDTAFGQYTITYPKVDTFHNYFNRIDYQFIGSTWLRGTPIPKGNMYQWPVALSAPNLQMLHDTLKLADPLLDSLVIDFPNFSIKRRIKAKFGDSTFNIRAYHDDFPALSGYHPKFNPSYPYASDSLEFFWDFDDTSAQNCVSTDLSPNPYCRYSREKRPRHIFMQNGCFNVSLTASDPLVGCSHTVTQAIAYQGANAGFDKTKYSSIDWEKQNRLLDKGEPLDGMGIRLEPTTGPCVGNAGNPNFMKIYTDGLGASCLSKARDYFMVFDAENECKQKVYTYDKNNNIIDSTYKVCSWYSSSTLGQIDHQWSYTTPGWKTIGVIAGGGGDTWDTFFYKNYIYIPDASVDFTVKQSSGLDSATQISQISIEQLKTKDREQDSLNRVFYEILKMANIYGQRTTDSIAVDSLDLLSNGLVDFTDTKNFSLAPGKYVIQSMGRSKIGCNGAQAQEYHVGHLASFRAKASCAGGVTTFYDSVYYWDKRGSQYCDFINWPQNTTCIDTSDFFYRPVALRNQYYGHLKGYTLPKFKEQIAWDYDNDGSIDDVNPKQPQFTFQKGGRHIVAMWTMDSLGHWLKTEKEIVIPDVEINISRSSTTSKYICTPAMVALDYKVTLYADSIFTLNNNYSPITIRNQDSGEFLLSFQNKIDFKLKLNVVTSSGCLDSLIDTTLFEFIGPRAEFIRTSKDTTCPNDSITATNTGDIGTYEWILEDPYGNNKETTRDLNYDHWYTAKGTIKLRTSQTVIHPVTNKQLQCTGTYPETGGIDFYHVEDLSSEFEITQRDVNNEVSFRIIDYYAFANYSYSIDGGIPMAVSTSDGSFTVTFPSTGDFNFCLNASSQGCSLQSCDKVWVSDVSVPSPDQQNITLYPNPAVDQLYISGLKTQHSYQIFSVLGEMTQNGSTAGSIEIGSLSEGVYIISIKLPEGWCSQRVVVKR